MLIHPCAACLPFASQDVRRQFPRVLDIGASHGALLPHLAVGFGVEEVVQVESSESMLMRDAELPEHAPEGVAVHRLAWDEEHLLLPPVRCDHPCRIPERSSGPHKEPAEPRVPR